MFFKLSPMNCVCPSLLFVSKICLHKRFLHILFCVSGCPSAVLYVSVTISHDVKLRSCIKVVFANYFVRLRMMFCYHLALCYHSHDVLYVSK